MCKIQNAIYDLVQHTESDILICSVNSLHIEGKLVKCEWQKNQNQCYDDIITLKDAVVVNTLGKQCEYKWLNIPSGHIQAFAFKCCQKS